MSTKRSKRKYVKQSYRWHRRVGVLVCLPLLLIAVTGVLLNHSEDLSLDSIFITQPTVLKWYGMEPRTPPVAINVDQHWLVALENLLYLDGSLVEKDATSPTGLAKLPEMIVVSTKTQLFLLTPNTKTLIEKLDSESLPEGEISAIAERDGLLRIDTTAGQFFADAQVSSFSQDEREPLPLVQFEIPPKELLEKVLESWRGRGVSIWRIVVDLHSGKFLGSFGGKMLGDIVAFCVILLVLSGLYNWTRHPT